MKIPEKAPDTRALLEATFEAILKDKKINYGEINRFTSEIDQKDKYLYWDKFKYLKLPENIAAAHLWTFLRFTRDSKIIKTGLPSKDGESFGYWIPSGFLENISFIDKHAGGEIVVGDSLIHKSEQKRYLVNSLMEEAIASSQLEGAATTRKVAKEMLRSGRKPRTHAEQMIYNNYKTISEIRDLLNKPLDDKLVLRLHKSMTADTLDKSECGRFRTEQDDAIHVCDDESNVLYEPPQPSKISPMMQILYNYANDTNDQYFVHPIIKAINLHFYLAYIHPFMDGNGRTARALFYWYALKKGYWMFEYLTISKMFLKAPSKYAKAFLYTEIDSLDLTYFISFNLNIINRAINELTQYILRKQKEAKDTTYFLKKYKDLNDRQRSLIKHAIDHVDARYTIVTHQNIHDITYEAARRDLSILEARNLLVKTKEGRKFCYIISDRLLDKLKRK